jgi:hypothetical protein
MVCCVCLIAWGALIQLGDTISIMPIGAVVISDIYKLEKRGTAMGVFLGV